MEDYLDDREQWERVRAWLREQGPWVLATVVVVLAAFGGWRYWQARNERRELAASVRYEEVLEAISQGQPALGATLADRLIHDFPGTAYAAQAELVAARVAVQNNQLAEAAKRLQHVIDTTHDPELKLVTVLRLARVQIAENKPDDALATLRAAKPGAFAARFAEVRGDALLAKGDRSGALQAYLSARNADDTLDSELLNLKINDLAHS